MELETSFARSVDALGTARYFVVSVVPDLVRCPFASAWLNRVLSNLYEGNLSNISVYDLPQKY